jgi:hypothetical protein
MTTTVVAATSIPWWAHLINAIGPAFPWVLITLLVVLVIISVFGNVGIDWKSKKFTFGRKEDEEEVKDSKRSCSDCIMLILGKRTQFESKYHNLQSRILRDQMTFAEHKIQEAKYFLLQTYQQDIEYFRQGDPDLVRENKEYLLYQEAVSNALFDAKDEIRRSFKENGFHTLDDSEFKMYTRDRTQGIITIVRDYLRRTYPSANMIVPLQDRFKRMDNRNIESIEIMISDLYSNAKTVRNKIEEEIIELEKNFIKEIDSLVGETNAKV